MNTLPHIKVIEKSKNEIKLHLSVDSKISYFTGHFPKMPVLAGVVQIQWAVQLAQEHLGTFGKFDRLDSVKFVNPIFPDSDLLLTLCFDDEKKTLTFSYEREGQKFSSGKVGFR